MGKLSAHFDAREFNCPCCGVSRTSSALIAGLEKLRALKFPNGLSIVSGYRCPKYNGSLVHAATASQHQYGTAADIFPGATLSEVKSLGAFSGIGWKQIGNDQMVIHVDVRHAGVNNTTGSSPKSPATWEYLQDGSRR